MKTREYSDKIFDSFAACEGPGTTAGERRARGARGLKRGRSFSKIWLQDWLLEPFDQPPTTNYIALCLNLSSNVLLKQVILLQKVDIFYGQSSVRGSFQVRGRKIRKEDEFFHVHAAAAGLHPRRLRRTTVLEG